MSEFRIYINDKLTDITDLKVAELKTELKKRGVSTTGNKQELCDKLRNVSRTFLPKSNSNPSSNLTIYLTKVFKNTATTTTAASTNKLHDARNGAQQHSKQPHDSQQQQQQQHGPSFTSARLS